MLTINHTNFQSDVLDSKKPVVLDFFATWCGPCKALHPLLAELSQKHPEYVFAQTDIDEEPELASQFRIMSVPTVKIFVNGQVKGTSIGLVSEAELLKTIEDAAKA